MAAELVVDGIVYRREPPEPHTPPAGWRLTGGPFCERCWLDFGISAGCRCAERRAKGCDGR